MRVLHIVSDCVPAEYRGGVSKAVYELARGQAENGHDVSIFALNRNSSEKMEVPLSRPMLSEGVKIVYFSTDCGLRLSSSAMRDALRRNVDQYEVIHSHNTFLSLNQYADGTASKGGCPVFYHVHGALDPIAVERGLVKSLKKRLYIRWVEAPLLRRAAGVFVLTECEEKQVRYWGISAPCHILPNGVGVMPKPSRPNIDEFRRRWRISSDSSVVLYVGRMIPKKRVDLLIRAFGEIARRRSDAVLILVGCREEDRNYVKSLDHVVRELGLQERVRWTGHLNEVEKSVALACACVFSHVSESEGMALSILEAMSVGLPVVVGSDCYMGSAVECEAVIECDYIATALADKLEGLLGDRVLCKRFGEKARAYTAEHHSWFCLAAQSIEVYRQSLRCS